jgi:hypothetical protein
MPSLIAGDKVTGLSMASGGIRQVLADQGLRPAAGLTFGSSLEAGQGRGWNQSLPLVRKGGPAMRLTWKDAVSTVFMAAIVVIYVAFLNSTTAWLISSARGTTAAVLVLGIVGGCGMSSADYQEQGTWARAYLGLASVLGITALVAGVVALITASTVSLAILVAATFALWLAATVRHTITRPAVRPGLLTPRAGRAALPSGAGGSEAQS